MCVWASASTSQCQARPGLTAMQSNNQSKLQTRLVACQPSRDFLRLAEVTNNTTTFPDKPTKRGKGWGSPATVKWAFTPFHLIYLMLVYVWPSLISSPHLLVLATNERFLPARGTFRVILVSERATGCFQCWYSPFAGDQHQQVWGGYQSRGEGGTQCGMYECRWVHKGVIIMPTSYIIYIKYGYPLFLTLQIYQVYYSYNPYCVSTFKLIIHYNEVCNLLGVQINMSFICESHLSLKYRDQDERGRKLILVFKFHVIMQCSLLNYLGVGFLIQKYHRALQVLMFVKYFSIQLQE